MKATLTENSKYMDWIIREHTVVELHANSIKMEVGFPQRVKKVSHSHPAGTKKCSFKEQGLNLSFLYGPYEWPLQELLCLRVVILFRTYRFALVCPVSSPFPHPRFQMVITPVLHDPDPPFLQHIILVS